jgi:small subunit ribosomal protein S16
MAVAIRMARFGAKKKPFYRIVAASKDAPRDGKFLEILGTHDPLTDPATTELKGERILEWIGKGAQPSDTVRSLMKKAGLLKADETKAGK